jgi:hypothetical protein
MKRSEIKIGTHVTYWGIIKSNGEKLEPKETHIISEAWDLWRNETVCKVSGISGCVSIKHLERRKVTPVNMTDAKTQEYIEREYSKAIK